MHQPSKSSRIAPGTIGDVDDAIVWQYRQELEQLASRLCGNPHDAEDVAQNALLKAVRGYEDFRGESTVRTWLHRIATNECLMMRRKKTPGSLDAMTQAGAASAYEPEDSARTPEELALVSEAQAEVLSALELLPPHHRTMVMLVDGCGMSYSDAAAATDTTVAAVRSNLFRARRTLRAHLADVA